MNATNFFQVMFYRSALKKPQRVNSILRINRKMLTLSDLAAESQAVLRLGGSRVMVINNADKKKKKKKKVRKLEREKSVSELLQECE
jgi:hypothetical protein